MAQLDALWQEYQSSKQPDMNALWAEYQATNKRPAGNFMPEPPVNGVEAIDTNEPGISINTPTIDPMAQFNGNPNAKQKFLDAKASELGKNAGEKESNLKSQKIIEGIINQMAQELTDLKSKGGTADEGSLAYLSNTEGADLPFGMQTLGGQDIARFRGTAEQKLRNQINQNNANLGAAYKTSSGTAASQMNSNAELTNFQKGLPKLTYDYDTNMNTLRNLSERYGTGDYAKSQRAPNSSGPIDYREYFK